MHDMDTDEYTYIHTYHNCFRNEIILRTYIIRTLGVINLFLLIIWYPSLNKLRPAPNIVAHNYKAPYNIVGHLLGICPGVV